MFFVMRAVVLTDVANNKCKTFFGVFVFYDTKMHVSVSLYHFQGLGFSTLPDSLCQFFLL